MASVLPAGAQQLALKLEVHQDVIKWLASEGVLNYEDLAMMASSEGEVDENIIKLGIAGGVDVAKRIKSKICIKKFWVACRKMYDADKGPKVDSSVVGANIPTIDESDINT